MVARLGESPDAIANLDEPRRIRPMHRPAAPGRKSVAVNPHEIDVAGPERHAILEHPRAFVDEWIEAARNDLFRADLAARDAGGLGCVGNHLVDDRVGDGRAAAGLVSIVARAALLPEPAQLVEAIVDARDSLLRIAQMREGFPIAIADIETGQVLHGERPHRHAEIGDGLVDFCGRGAFFQQELGLAQIARQHAIADEPVTDPSDDRKFPEPLAERQCGGEGFRRCRFGAHHLEQPHHVRRREEVQAEHLAGPPRQHCRDLVDVEIGGIGGQDGVGLCDLVERGEHLLLDGHLLEHRFDDDVGVLQHVVARHRRDEAHALLDIGGGEAALRSGRLVVLPDIADAALELRGVGIENRNRNARIRKAHGDAGAHGARADHRGARDWHRPDVLGDARNLGGRALGEEDVAQRPAFRRHHAGFENLALAFDALIERQVHRRLDAIDACNGCLLSARLLGDFGALGIEPGFVLRLDRFVAGQRMGTAGCNTSLRKSHRA